MAERKTYPSALTVAGVDSCGGAGVAADLKTFAALRVHGACVVTTLTSQNTEGIRNILPISPEFIRNQIEVVLSDLRVDAVKTGVLFADEAVRVVAEVVEDRGLKVVVDPIFWSRTGEKLATEDAVQAYIRDLIPAASLTTPNIPEATKITGVKIKDTEDMKRAARKILELGVKGLVIKGGHLRGNSVQDLLLYEDEFKVYRKPKLEASCHGTGCCFSAAIAAYLARGLGIREAVENSESFIREVLEYCLEVGKGWGVANPIIPLYNEAERYDVMENVNSAVKVFQETKEILPYIAEVGTQIGMGLPFPSSILHVAAVDGRLRKEGDKIKAGSVEFGASSHIANLILACHKLDPAVRAALNLHYDAFLVEALKETGLTVSSFERRYEPRRVKETEGETLRWGVRQATLKAGKVPDVVYDMGEEGKEPMVRITGLTALDAVEKVRRALACLKQKGPGAEVKP